MLMPKRTKYRKVMRGRMTGKAYRGSAIAFGEFGLQSVAPAWFRAARSKRPAARSPTT
jgi:large subunit ribosomal protein L16